jgi:hypothetical protein
VFKISPSSLQFCAALVWTVAGVKLFYRGMTIVLVDPVWWVIGVTVLVGLIKSRVILDRVCRKNVERLKLYSGNEFILHIFPLRTWLIIATMIIFGRLLRMCPAGREWSGLFSLAVGTGLLFASRISWKGWWNLRVGVDK